MNLKTLSLAELTELITEASKVKGILEQEQKEALEKKKELYGREQDLLNRMNDYNHRLRHIKETIILDLKLELKAESEYSCEELFDIHDFEGYEDFLVFTGKVRPLNGRTNKLHTLMTDELNGYLGEVCSEIQVFFPNLRKEIKKFEKEAEKLVEEMDALKDEKHQFENS